MSPEELHHPPRLAPHNGHRMPEEAEETKRKRSHPKRMLLQGQPPLPMQERMSGAQHSAAAALQTGALQQVTGGIEGALFRVEAPERPQEKEKAQPEESRHAVMQGHRQLEMNPVGFHGRRVLAS